MDSRWAAVDDYTAGALLTKDTRMEAVLAANAVAGLPPIDVSPAQGKLLYLLSKTVQARRILEIGTLGGYSTLWLASALAPEGKVITLEIDPHHASIAQSNFQRMELTERIDLRIGPARDSLESMVNAGEQKFDLVFIDADKQSNAEYVRLALTLSRPGTIIVCDNVVREGRILEEESGDPNITGTRRLYEFVAADERLDATVVQTVGAKGWDGFMLIHVLGDPNGGAR